MAPFAEIVSIEVWQGLSLESEVGHRWRRGSSSCALSFKRRIAQQACEPDCRRQCRQSRMTTCAAVFVLREHHRDLIEVPWWTGDGLYLRCKRLEHGRFAWSMDVSSGCSRLPGGIGASKAMLVASKVCAARFETPPEASDARLAQQSAELSRRDAAIQHLKFVLATLRPRQLGRSSKKP